MKILISYRPQRGNEKFDTSAFQGKCPCGMTLGFVSTTILLPSLTIKKIAEPFTCIVGLTWVSNESCVALDCAFSNAAVTAPASPGQENAWSQHSNFVI